jgi:hypothetical protein
MPDEPSSERRGGFLAFWTTLPGILTGVAALITAIVGAIGLWRSQSDGNSAGSTNQPVTATSAAQTGTSSGHVARGRLSLVRGDWADLERGQVGNSTDADVTFGPGTTPTLLSAGSAFLAPAQARPTKRSCTTALRARHDTSEIVSELDTNRVRVSTTEGHVAVARIISAPGVGSAKLVLGYTVWP